MSTNSKSLTLQPIDLIQGEIHLPGSKSVSNRALLLAAMAQGKTKLTNLLNSDDIYYMLKALKELGVHYQLSEDKKTCVIQGVGRRLCAAKALTLYLGNAGTAMRPLAAALSLVTNNHPIILTGEPRMKERPIGHLVDALSQGGAVIDYLENEGFPPIKVQGGFNGGKINIDGSISSQFLTAVLMVVPLAGKNTEIHVKGELVSKPYIDITLALMREFGVNVVHDAEYRCFMINGNQHYCSPGYYLIEGDASSASYFLAAAAIKGGTVRVTGIGRKSVQGDIAFAFVLEQMGAHIHWGDDFIECQVGVLNGIELDVNHIPDAAMTLAIVALFAKGPTCLKNIYNWRVKETDRLTAMAIELRKVGATVEEGNDYIRITPPLCWQHARIETYNDHRMAMCFSLIALSPVAVTILDPGCVSKTFPDYFSQLEKLIV